MHRSLFEPWRIRAVTVRNRVIRSATNMRMAGSRGEVEDELVAVHATLAEGGVGLDITGHAFVSPEGRAKTGQLGCHDDVLVGGLSRLADAAHGGGAPIILQLSHAGAEAQPLQGVRIAPWTTEGSRSMSTDEVERIADAFVGAARRAVRAGFDGVQLHAAHGYLLNQFLSPLTNKRHDAYWGRQGGIRLLCGIIEGIRAGVDRDVVIAIKAGVDSDIGGNSSADLVHILEELTLSGLDMVEISKGMGPRKEIIKTEVMAYRDEAYNLKAALSVKKSLPDLTVVVVGGVRSVEVAEKIVRDGMDAVAMSRPLLAEPLLPRRWMEGDRRPATCRSCSRCLGEAGAVRCRQEDLA